MLRSMTGFGYSAQSFAGLIVSVEIKALNSKAFDLSVRLPKDFIFKEMAVRSRVQKVLERGKISVQVNVEHSVEANRARIDHKLLKAYFDELWEVGASLGATADSVFRLSAGMPLVVIQEQADEEQWLLVDEVFEQALNNTLTFRQAEGAVLEDEIHTRVTRILESLQAVDDQDGQMIPLIKERIRSKLAAFVELNVTDLGRLEQEMVYFTEKLDITEEKLRLKTHCNYFLQTMREGYGNGKKLGFISQEMGREINTLGAKVSDAEIQQFVIGMKDELEKIKEQLLNVI